MLNRLRRTNDLAFVLVAVALMACGDKHNNPQDGGNGLPDTGVDVDAATIDAVPIDAAPTFGLTSVFPAAASRTVDTTLTLSGFGISGTPSIVVTNCDQPSTTYTLTVGAATATSITTVLAASTTRVQGAYTVSVTNGDGMVASLQCALHIVAEPPPTVTLVIPDTAWQGAPNDGINSDATVSIEGTGFISVPSVRWVSTSNPAVSFDALFVGYVSPTHITAVAPSETLSMPADSYNVFVTNPDLLTAAWMSGANMGVFTVTATPPPSITSVTPSRIQNNICTTASLTIAGSNFQANATAWYVVPTGTTCTGSSTDANGNTLCPIVVDAVTPTAITTHFASCPALGPYPVVVINPDDQSAYWYSIEVTPSSDGHLNTGAFEIQQNRLVTARWKHALEYGFDVYSDALAYVAGGQDANGNVLGSVEVSQFDLFGTPGPFRELEQYFGTTTPRRTNTLNTARGGSTLVRTGTTLWSIGGTTQRSDTTTVVPGSKVVERAEILGYGQMPAIAQPTQTSTTGLPVGSWYYRVSAIGPWGESLPTREVVAINKRGAIEVCWVAPTATGATGYNVYRSLAADGRAGTSAALAFEVSNTANCFTDTGTEKLAPAPGNLRGSLTAGGTQLAGTYIYRVSAVVPLTGGGTWETYAGYASATTIAATDITAGNQTVLVAWDAVPISGVVYRLYRQDSNGAYKLLTGANALTSTSFQDGGVAFDASSATPRTETMPLPPGSLSKWDATTPPQLTTSREGLDGVVIAMDPNNPANNNMVARIIVAGGRDGTTGTYTYHTSAESLGIYADGTTEATWSAEAPVFAHARAYYALLSTQNRNVTPFPPPPTEPPCSINCGQVIQRVVASLPFGWSMTAAVGRVIAKVASTEPVYLVAVLGDDAFQASANKGRNDFESCLVDPITGHLAADCGVTNASTWTVQDNNVPNGSASFGMDAVLYFSYLYPFYGVSSETVTAIASTIQIAANAVSRFPLVPDLTMVTAGQILQTFQSASTSFVVHRAYYQMTRLLAYVYVVGGYGEAHTDPVTSLTVPAGPTDLVERHQQ